MKVFLKIVGIVSVVGLALAGVFAFLNHREEKLID